MSYRYMLVASDNKAHRASSSGSEETMGDVMKRISDTIQGFIDKDNLNVKHVTIAIGMDDK